MMKPEMVIAIIKSANVMKTPEKPKAKTVKAMVQSVICDSSLKNGKILLKPLGKYNGWRENFLDFALIRCYRGSILPLASPARRAHRMLITRFPEKVETSRDDCVCYLEVPQKKACNYSNVLKVT